MPFKINGLKCQLGDKKRLLHKIVAAPHNHPVKQPV
jgi:hypothetical protein